MISPMPVELPKQLYGFPDEALSGFLCAFLKDRS